MIKDYIQAARLRTLPLSISGIIVGTSIARFELQPENYVDTSSNVLFFVKPYLLGGDTNYTIFVLALLTTIGFQILSNFANDYGDGVKGTDNNERIGPKRALQTGAIQPKEMMKAIIITSLITFGIALWLIYESFGKDNFLYSVIFLFLGIASIGAAIKYTMGKSAYGYSGFGDIFVFLFFGLLSVLGTYFLYQKQIYLGLFFPAFTIGLLSTAVLNLNNMRDIDNDRNAAKNTLVVKIGSQKAKTYHYFLIFGSLLFALVFTLFTFRNLGQFLFLIAYIPLGIHVFKVKKITSPREFDPELKKVALSTFLFAILFSIGLFL